MKSPINDTETEVCNDIKSRQQLGINKYGQTVAQNPLELRQWLQHSYEEKLDDAVYMKRAIQELDRMLAAGLTESIDAKAITEKIASMLGTKMSDVAEAFKAQPKG